ncbi:MAG: response regulator [Bacteroidales bacterium]|nr:response regulator [Bacteroidales bacterium]
MVLFPGRFLLFCLLFLLFTFIPRSISQEIPGNGLTENQRELLIADLIEKSGDRVRWSHNARLDFARTAYEYAQGFEKQDLKMRAMFNMAELFFQQGNFDHAFQYFDTLQVFGKETGDLVLEIKTKCYIGSIYRYKGEIYEALGITYDAHRLVMDSDLAKLISLTSNHLGIIYRNLGDTAIAMEYYRKALDNALEFNDTNQIILAYTYLGNHFRTEGYAEKAHEHYLTAMELAIRNNDMQNIASLNNNIGNIYRDRGDYDQALEYYNLAYGMLDEIFLAGLETVILRNIGVTFMLKGDLDEAYNYITRSLENSQNAQFLWLMRDNYFTLSEIHHQRGEDHQAYNYLKQYNQLNQQIFNDRLFNSINYFNDRIYDAQRKEELYRFRWQRNLLLLTIVGLGLLFLISLFVLIFSRLKEKKFHVESLESTIREKESTEKALRQSEENYQTLIRTLNEGLVVLDLDNKIEFVNFKACKVLGVKDKSELTGRNFKEFLLTPEDEKLYNDKMELQKMGISDHYEVKMKNVSGDLLWVNLSSAPILDENLKSKGSVTLITDVSDRKKYEETYSDLTTDLNQKIKQLNCMYDISDISGVPGITFEEIIEKSLEIIPVGLKYTHDIGVQIMFDNKVYASDNYKETPWSYIVPIKVQKKKLGHIKVAYLEQKPKINKDPFHFNEKILLKNISEKFGQILEAKNLEKVLRENQERLQEIQRIAKIGNWEKDLVSDDFTFSENFFNIAEISPERRKFFGIEKLLEIIHPEDKTTFNELINDDDLDNSILSYNYRIITQQGLIKNIYSSRKVVRDDNDQPFRVIYTLQDVTEQKINQDLKYSAEVALRTSEARQQVLADMSYEMRTPLNGIIGVVEFLLKSDLTPEQMNLTKTIKDSSEGLMNIINNIQDLSRIEYGNLEMHDKVFDINQFTERISNLFSALTRHKELKLRIVLDKKIPAKIVADEIRLNQVISNLISNAVKRNEKGEIHLKLWPVKKHKEQMVIGVEIKDPFNNDDTRLPLNIIDSLEGISDTDIYKSEELSLSISFKLVELMGGVLSMKTDKKQGSIASFDFIANQAEKTTGKSDRNGNQEKILKTIEGLKVLYAEDKIINQKVIKLMLSHAKVDVALANNGAEALDMMTKHNYDVILLDMIMPVMDGMETVKAIREKFDISPPLIGVTASTMEKSKKLYLDNGLDDIITKPVNQAELYEKLAHWHLMKTKTH